MNEQCPFTILVDTNEQAPYSFQGMEFTWKGKRRRVDVPTIEKRLPVDHGDYMVDGINWCSSERKSLEDWYSTLGSNRDDFKKQIETMNLCLRKSFVVIEASWDEIKMPQGYYSDDDDWRSKLSPNSAFAVPFSWMLRFPRVTFIAAGDRRMAEIITFEILTKAWQHEQERKKELAKAKQMNLIGQCNDPCHS